MGVGAGDFDRIEALLDAILAHQEPSGRFPSYDVLPGGSEPIWGSLLCDSHPILEVLVRFGREKDPGCSPGSPEWRPISPPPLRGARGHAYPTLPRAGAVPVASPTSARW